MLTGQRIADLRKKAGITQDQLAEKLYVTREMVSKWAFIIAALKDIFPS